MLCVTFTLGAVLVGAVLAAVLLWKFSKCRAASRGALAPGGGALLLLVTLFSSSLRVPPLRSPSPTSSHPVGCENPVLLVEP